MTPTQIKATLASLGSRPNKKLGQHFLIDIAALDTIVTAADIHPGDTVLEVGPGLGVLTGRLLNTGAEIHAIEQDRLFLPHLEKMFVGQALSITHGDAASVHWHELVGDRPWKLISNLPYSITSLALRKALYAPRPAERVVVLIQKEVADRVVARDKKTSLLSLMVALASSSARIVRRVPPGAFYPPPKVQSAVLEIFPLTRSDREQRWGMDPEKIMALARLGFAHPRKQLASNLAAGIHVGAHGVRPGQNNKTFVQSLLRDLSLSPTVRAEDLSPEQWAALTKHLSV